MPTNSSEARSQTTAHARRRPVAIAGLCAVLLLPVAAAYGLMARFLVDLPFGDDYWAILNFANRLVQMHTLRDRLQWCLFAEHNGYRIVFLHLVVWSDLALTRRIQFTVLDHAGNLLLLPLLYVLWRTFFTDESDLARRLKLFLPIAFLLFGLNYVEMLYWPTAGLMYSPNIFFAFASLLLLAPPERIEEKTNQPIATVRFALACISASVACLACGTGAILLPLGLLVLVRRRAFVQGIVWCASFGLGLLPYLLYRNHAPFLPGGNTWLTSAYFLAFLGAGVPTTRPIFEMHQWPYAIAGGIAVCLVAAHALVTRYDRLNLAAPLMTLWLMGCALLVAFGRTANGIEWSTQSRYKIFSDLAFILCFGYTADRLRRASLPRITRRALYAAALTVSILVCAVNDRQALLALRAQRDLLRLGAFRYWQAPAVNSPMYFNWPPTDQQKAADEVTAKGYLEESMRLGIYHLPKP